MSASLTKSEPHDDPNTTSPRTRIWWRLARQRRPDVGIEEWTNKSHGRDTRSNLNSQWPSHNSSRSVGSLQRTALETAAATRPDAVWAVDTAPSRVRRDTPITLNSGRLLIAGDLAATLTWALVWQSSSAPYVLAATITLLLCASGGLYRPRLHVSLLDQLPSLLGRLGIATAAAAVITVWFASNIDLYEYVYRSAILVTTHVTVRGLGCSAIRAARERGAVKHETLIVGNSSTSHKVTKILDDNPMYGLRVVGYVGRPSSAHEETPGWRNLGDTSQILELIEKHDISVIVLDDDIAGYTGALAALRGRMGLLQSLFVVPRIVEAGISYDLDDHIGAIPVLRVRVTEPGLAQRASKRCFDVILSAVLLIALAPLMLTIAASIYLDDRHGVLFRQIRVGLHGKVFTMYKFRSMRPPAAHTPDTQWTTESQSRISRIGKVLRKTSLDELPQLANILKGDMTFVGPRPERPHFVEQFSASLPHYRYRHRVQVGLTGLAQVSGLRGDTSIDDRARHDNYYIDHWNLWFDLKVILWTLGQVVRAKGG